MPKPFVQEFQEFGITSIVIDENEFNEFIDELSGIFDANTQAAKKLKCLPLMTRGTKTEQFFERWGVKTDKLSVIVRGHGQTLLNQMAGRSIN